MLCVRPCVTDDTTYQIVKHTNQMFQNILAGVFGSPAEEKGSDQRRFDLFVEVDGPLSTTVDVEMVS
jgi:hypothetical protein